MESRQPAPNGVEQPVGDRVQQQPELVGPKGISGTCSAAGRRRARAAAGPPYKVVADHCVLGSVLPAEPPSLDAPGAPAGVTRVQRQASIGWDMTGLEDLSGTSGTAPAGSSDGAAAKLRIVVSLAAAVQSTDKPASTGARFP
jgi:hypothetical protein